MSETIGRSYVGLEGISAGAASGDARAMMMYDANKKSTAVSYILWLFMGGIGGHRFYNGKTGSAVAQLLLSIFGFLLLFAGGIGGLLLLPVAVWVLVDAFLIPGWVRSHNNLLAYQLNGR